MERLQFFNINQTGSLGYHLQTNLHIMKCKGTPPPLQEIRPHYGIIKGQQCLINNPL